MDENAVDKAINASQEKAGMEEEARPDYPDVDGDGDTKEPMAKAAKDKKKKMKKESIDSRLAEIGKEAEAVKLEAQLDFLHDHIQEKVDRVDSINEDDNLKELIDKSKMKAMQKEIKLLEKRKGKMEKMYEKMCGKKYKKAEMVDEMDAVSWNEKNNPTRGAAGERDPKKVGQSTSAYAINEMAAGGLKEKSAGKKLFAAFKKDGLKPNYIADVRKVSSDGEAKDMVHIEPGEGSVEVSSSSNQDKIAQTIKSAGFNISKEEDNVGNYKLSVFTIDIK
jgi:hypothetical protein